jgi:hypothetical protein
MTKIAGSGSESGSTRQSMDPRIRIHTKILRAFPEAWIRGSGSVPKYYVHFIVCLYNLRKIKPAYLSYFTMESSALNFLTAFRILVETRTGPELPVLPELPELPELPALPVLPVLPVLPGLPAHTEQQTIFSSVNVFWVIASVAGPGCLSRIPDPDFCPSRIPDLGSRIPDPKTATKERGEKNLMSYLSM